MSAKNMGVAGVISAGLLSAFLLTGCGFKSDLFMPESEVKSDLFTPDTETETTVTVPPLLPSADGEIMLDKVTTTAADGQILVPAGGDDVEGEGVPVDLTRLQRDVERERNTQ